MQEIKETDISRAIDQGSEKLKHAAKEAQKSIKNGQEQVQDMIEQADEQLHENPWPILAGVALGCLFLGFIAGKAR